MLYQSSMVDGQWTRGTENEHRFMLWQVVTWLQLGFDHLYLNVYKLGGHGP